MSMSACVSLHVYRWLHIEKDVACSLVVSSGAKLTIKTLSNVLPLRVF